MILFCRDVNVVPETPTEASSSEKDERESGRKKTSGTRRVHDLVTFVLIIYSSDYLKEVEQFVKKIDGVKSVKVDHTSNKLVVEGKVDPFEIQKRITRKKKRKVKLIFPPAESASHKDETRRPDEEVDKKNRQDNSAAVKSEEGVMVLKVKLCCDSCNRKFKKILNGKGFEIVSMDSNQDIVKVKGTVNITELKSTVKRELNRDIEVVISPKTHTTATEKKDKETGATNKKEKDAGFPDKKGKEVEASETVSSRKNSEGEGNASVQNKRENKDIKHNSHRRNGETSTSTSSSQETVNDSMRSYPNPYNQRSVDPRYYYVPGYHGYYRPHPPPPPPQPSYSNGLDMFSDENPHSCIIM